MNVSEDFARDMRCCGPDGCGEQRRVQDYKGADFYVVRLCVASECMAWRFGTELVAKEFSWPLDADRSAFAKEMQARGASLKNQFLKPATGTELVAVEVYSVPTELGFCGLAGRPE